MQIASDIGKHLNYINKATKSSSTSILGKYPNYLLVNVAAASGGVICTPGKLGDLVQDYKLRERWKQEVRLFTSVD